MLKKAIGITIIFLFGLVAGLYFASEPASAWVDGDYENGIRIEAAALNPFASVTPKESPADRIAEDNIAVYKDRVVLDIQNAQWATFTDTHSMEPVLVQGANALELVPHSADEIKVGDIVSYQSDLAEGTIIHRVIYKGQDEQGTYFIMKGDNLPTSDPGRVRFSQIERVVVGIIY
jgi:hypothetical protein